VFAVDIEHSLAIVQAYRAAGVRAAHVDGTTPVKEREHIMSRFGEREITLLSNVGIVTEGYDCPEIACIQAARPTKSVALYFQMIGRALRPATGKTDALILDHAGVFDEHGSVLYPVDWSLDAAAVSQNAAASRQKNPDKESEGTIENVVLENGDVLLVEVGGGRSMEWLQTLQYLIKEKAQNNRKPLWVAHKLRDCCPGLTQEDWKIVARALKFHHRWVDHWIENVCIELQKTG